MSRLARSTCITTQAIANALPLLPMPFRSLTNRYLRQDGSPKDVGATLPSASNKALLMSVLTFSFLSELSLQPRRATGASIGSSKPDHTSDITMGQSCTVTSTSAGSGAGEVDRL